MSDGFSGNAGFQFFSSALYAASPGTASVPSSSRSSLAMASCGILSVARTFADDCFHSAIFTSFARAFLLSKIGIVTPPGGRPDREAPRDSSRIHREFLNRSARLVLESARRFPRRLTASEPNNVHVDHEIALHDAHQHRCLATRHEVLAAGGGQHDLRDPRRDLCRSAEPAHVEPHDDEVRRLQAGDGRRLHGRWVSPRQRQPRRGPGDVGPRRDQRAHRRDERPGRTDLDRKSTRLNSSHPSISYAVFCLKKKKKKNKIKIIINSKFTKGKKQK